MRRRKLFYIFFSILLVGCFIFTPSLSAQNIPKKIHYEGLLTDKSGAPVSGDYTITIRIYDALTGGTELFEEDHSISLTVVDRGIFNFTIGSVTTLNLDFDEQYWFSLEVTDSGGNSDGEMTPRQQINSVPYSMNAELLDGLDSEQFLRSDADDTMSGSLTIFGSLYVEGKLTSSFDPLDGTSNDSFTIDSPQDSADLISLIFGETNDERLEFSLSRDQFILTDDLSILGALTVQGFADLENGLRVSTNLFTVDTSGNVFTAGNLSVGGNADLQSDVDLGTDATDTISFYGNIGSDLTFSNPTIIRTAAGDLTFDPAGNIILGQSTANEAILSGDLTVQGNDIFSSTALAITMNGSDIDFAGNVTVQGSTGLTFTDGAADLIFGNGEYIENDTAGILGIGGNLSISDDLTAWGTGTSRIRNGNLIVGTGTPSIASGPGDVFIENDIEIGGGISLAGALTFGGLLTNQGQGVTIDDDLTVTGVVFLDELDAEANSYIRVSGDIDFVNDVTFGGTNVYTSNGLTINPVQGGQGFLTIGNLTESDSVILGGDVTITGSLSVSGTVPELQLFGTTADTFTIDTDDTSDTPSLIFEDTDGDEYLRWNDLEGELQFSDNLSVGGQMTITNTLRVEGSGRSRFIDGRVQIGPGVHTGIADDDGDLFVTGDVEIGGNLSIGSDTTIAGVLFGDDGITIIGDLTVTETAYVDLILNESTTNLSIGNGMQTVSIDSSDWDIDTTGNMTGIGNVTLDGTLLMTQDVGTDLNVAGNTVFGNAAGDTHDFRGAVTFGIGEQLTISDTGDLTVEGDTNLGDTVGDTFTLISSGLNVTSTGEMSDAGGAVIINDSLSVAGDLSVGQELLVYGTNATRILNGRLVIGADTPTDVGNDAGDVYVQGDTEIGGDLSVGESLTLGGTFFSPAGLFIEDDVTITGTLFVDIVRKEADSVITFNDDVLFTQDLTIGGGNLYSNGNLTINPDQDGTATLFLGEPGQNDLVAVEGDLTVAGDVTVGGTIYGTSALSGTIQDEFIIDTDDTSDTPTLFFEDTDGDEYLRWNDLISMLELSDDVSIDGGLTIYGDLIVEGGPVNVSFFNGANTRLQLTDGNLEIYGDGPGPVGAPSTGFSDDGDLFVEGDFEVVGNLSLGGDTTIAGVIFGDGFTQVDGPLTATDDLDVRGNLYDGASDIVDIKDDLSVSDNLTVLLAVFIGADDATDDYIRFADNTEALFWDESEDVFNMTDDLSVEGDLTVNGSSFLGNDVTDLFIVRSSGFNVNAAGQISDFDSEVEVLDSLSVSGELSVGSVLSVYGTGPSTFLGSDMTLLIQDGNVQILSSTESVSPSAGFTDDGDLFVEDGLEMGSDISIGEALTVLGSVFFGDQNTDLFILTSSGLNISRRGTMFDFDSQLIFNDDVSITGELSINDNLFVEGPGLSQFINGRVQIGPNPYTGIADDDGDLYVQGDVEIGGDLSIDGDTTIAGVIFSDDATQIEGNLTVNGDLDIRGNIFDGLSDVVDVRRNLSVEGDLTVGQALFIGFNDGVDDMVRFSGDAERFLWDESLEQFFMSDDLSINGTLTVHGGRIELLNSFIDENLSSTYTAISSQNNTFAVYDGSDDQTLIIYNDTGDQFLNLNLTEDPHATILASSQLRLKADNDTDSYIYISTPNNVPTINTDATSILGIDSGADSIVIASGDDLSVANTMFVDATNNEVGINTQTPDYELEVIGSSRVSQNLTVGGDELILNESQTDTTVFFANRTQFLRWDESDNEFDMQGSLSVNGSVTVAGTLKVGSGAGSGAFNIIDNNDGVIEASSMMDGPGDLFIDGDEEITGDVSIGGMLTIANTFHVGSTSGGAAYNVIDSDGVFSPSSLMNARNDLYIEGDLEVFGNLSMGGDTTIVGVIFSDDGTTVIGDLTVTGELFVDAIDDEIGQGLDFNAPVTFNQDLTINNTSLFSTGDLLINPNQFGSGTLTLGGVNEGDEIFMNGDVTLNGNMSISGDFTTGGTIYGNFSIAGTAADTFTIDTDDSSDFPTLFFEDTDGDEFIRWNDPEQSMEISDDMSVDGGLTLYGDLIVQGGPVNTNFFNGSDATIQIADGSIQILADSTNITASGGFTDDGDIFAEGDVEIGGSLSIGGDTTIAGVIFSDDFTEIIGELTTTGDLDVRGNIFDGVGDWVEFLDNVSMSGLLNVDGIGVNEFLGDVSIGGTLSIGGGLNINGDVEVGGDLSVRGDTTIAGVIFGDDFTQIEGTLTVTGDLDVRGNIYDGLGDELDFLDDISATGALSLGDYIRVGRTGTGTIAVGGTRVQAYNVIGDAGAVTSASLSSDHDLLIQGSLEIDEQIYVEGVGLNDLDGYLNIGSITTEGGNSPGDLAISGDLTIVGDNIDSINPLVLNAGQGSPQPVFIGTTTHVGVADDGGDLYVLNDVEIGGSLSIGSDTTIGGVLFSDGFTQIEGSLTVTGDLDVRGNIFDGGGPDVDIKDNLSISGDATVWNNLYVLGSGQSEITNGRLLIGDGSLQPSIADGTGELYVAGDAEVHGDLSIGGDTTIAGVVFSDDATQIIGDLTVQGNIYPWTDDTYDLGSPSAEWRDLYIDGTANIDSLVADTADIDGGTIDNVVIGGDTPGDATFNDLTVNDNTIIGSDATDAIFLNAEFVSDLVPDVDGAFDFGTAAQGWRDMYLAAQGFIIWGGTERFTYDGINFTMSDDLSLAGTLSVEGTGESTIAGYLNIASTTAVNVGDVGLSGDLTVEDSMRIGSDGTGTISIGGAPIASYNAIADSGQTPGNLAVISDNDLFVGGTVEIDGQLDVDGTGLNSIAGYVELGNVGTSGGDNSGDLAIEGDLTVVGDNIDSVGNPLLLNSGTASNQPVYIGTTTHIGIADEGGDLYVENDVEIGGDLSVAGDTSISGVLFSSGNLTISGDLDIRGNIFDGTGDTVEIVDNLSVSEQILVEGSTFSHFYGDLSVDGALSVGQGIFVVGEMEVLGDLSIGGDVTIGGVIFSSTFVRIEGNLSVTGNVDVRKSILDGAGDTVEIEDNLSVSGTVNVDGTGVNQFDGDLNVDGDMSVGNTLIVTSDVDIGGSLSIAGDTTIAGVIFSDDYTQIEGALTVTDDLDIRGNIYDGVGGEVDVVDNLSVTGNVSLTDFLHVGADGDGTIAVGGSSIQVFNIIGDSAAGRDNANVSSDDDLYIEGTLEVDGELDIDGTGLNDIEGRMELGAITTEGGVNDGDLAISGDLTVVGGNIDSVGGPLLLNAGQGSNQPVFIGVQTFVGLADGPGDLYVDGDLEINGDVSIGGDATIGGVLFSTGFLQIRGNLTVDGDVDIRGNIYDGVNDEVDILDDLSLTGNMSLTGYVRVGRDGTGTIAVGGASVQAYNIIGDDTTGQNSPNVSSDDDLFIQGTLEVNEQIDIDGTGLNDIEGRMELGSITTEGGSNPGDLAISGDLTILGGRIDSPNSPLALNAGQASNQPVFIGTQSHNGIASGAGDLFVNRNIEIGGSLSVAGDTTIAGVIFSDGTLEITGSLTVTDDLDVRGNILDGTGPDVDIADDVSITGALSLTNDLRVGRDGTGTIAIGGAAIQTYNIIGDDTVGKNNTSVTSDDDLYIQGTLEVNEQIDIDGTALNDLEGRLELGSITTEGGTGQGDLAISGDMTILGGMLDTPSTPFVINAGQAFGQPVYIGVETHIGIADEGGDLYVENDVEVRGDLSIGNNLTVQSFSFNTGNLQITGNLDIRGNILDGTGPEVDIADDVSIDGSLTVDAGVLVVDAINDRVGINTLSPQVALDVVGDAQVSLDMTIGNELSVANQIQPTIFPGTASTTWVIDFNDASNTPTLQFEDATQDETLLWNDGATVQSFELSDDLSILGQLTLSLNEISFGNGARIINLDSQTLSISESIISFSNNVTIANDLTILGSGMTHIPNGRVTVGDDSLNTLANGVNDVFVGGDLEVLGTAFATTLSGALEADGTTQPQFIIDQNSAIQQLDVVLYFSDDGNDNAHFLKWADNADHFGFSDDLTINGNLTVTGSFHSLGNGSSTFENGRIVIGTGTPGDLSDDIGDLFVTEDVEIGGDVSIGGDVTIAGVIFGDGFTQINNSLTVTDDLDVRGHILDGAADAVDILDNLSISGDLSVLGGDIKGLGVTNIDMGELLPDIITVTGDFSVSGDATISGNLSVAGSIVGINDTYVNETGDTMTGTLFINTPGALALDIDGDIEYTGSLKNLSPVKFQDGINIVNLGGISGGQILGKDVVVAMDDSVAISRSESGRTIFVPKIKFVRYTKKTPTIALRKDKVYPINGYIPVSIGADEHIIHVKSISNEKFVRDVGRDGELSREGDYKIGTRNKVKYFISDLDTSRSVEIEYSVRVDENKPNRIEHVVFEELLPIPDGAGVLYLEEIPLDEVSEHDTAAMSPSTVMVVRFETLDKYDYSADRYVVAIVTEDDFAQQYIQVNR